MEIRLLVLPRCCFALFSVGRDIPASSAFCFTAATPLVANQSALHKAMTYIVLLAQGKAEYNTVKEMRDDPEFFIYTVGIVQVVPSAETLQQRMDGWGICAERTFYKQT